MTWPGWHPADGIGGIAWLEREYDGAEYNIENPFGRFGGKGYLGISYTAWMLSAKTPDLVRQRQRMFNHRPMFEILEIPEAAFVDDSAWDCAPDMHVSEMLWGTGADEVPERGPEGVR